MSVAVRSVTTPGHRMEGYLAFSLRDESEFSSLYIWSLTDEKLHRVTGPYADEYAPAWDPEGKYLFFLAAERVRPADQFGRMELCGQSPGGRLRVGPAKGRP